MTDGASLGLAGGSYTHTTITTSYHDSDTTGETDTTTIPTGKTTSQLQSVTDNSGIYSGWSTDKWNFGTTFQYPRIKADWDGDGTATAAEFGEQDASYDQDYDLDDDGLIDVDSIAKLFAIRWDLNGDGAASSDDRTKYETAFPYGLTSPNMGCNEDAANDSDKVCTGYELTAGLDFDSEPDGDVDINDHSGAWWDGGKGWGAHRRQLHRDV